MNKKKFTNGFTLIEILIAIALVALMGGLTILFLNPPSLLARGRNAERKSHLYTIINAIWQNKSDNNGNFNCVSGDIPTTTAKMAIGVGNYNIAPCLVPIYLPTMPYDSKAGGAHYASNTDYDTGYNIVGSATSGRITLNAPWAELGEIISVTR